MGIEIAISVVGIVVAAVISIATYRRSNPKRQLRYRLEVTPLLAASTEAGGRLTVSFDEKPVTNPQIVSLSVWSTGRADIGSDAFDGGTPLTFNLGVPILEVTPADNDASPRLRVSPPDSVVIAPALLHRRFQSTVRLVVDGAPEVRVNHVLPNIDVLRDGVSATTRAIDTSRKRFRITPLLAWTGVLILGVVALVIGLVVSSIDYDAGLPWGVVSILTVMVSLAAIVVIGIYRLVRWIARNVEARSGLR